MKIAIPVFGRRISPRFDFAPAFGVFDIREKKIADRREVACEGWGDEERILLLRNLGVETMICGGLPERLRAILVNVGIQVIPWIAGCANDALALYLQGKLEPGAIVCSRRGAARGGRCGGRGPGIKAVLIPRKSIE